MALNIEGVDSVVAANFGTRSLDGAQRMVMFVKALFCGGVIKVIKASH